MLPCCDLCYKKYITEDGDLDSVRLKKARDELFKQCPKYMERYASLFGMTLKELRATQAASDGFCDCPCHQDGRSVLH